MKVVGFMGFKGSGKDSAALALLNTGSWEKMAFADSLKGALSAIFGWDRSMLEGTSAESRNWRETVDTWWSNRLGIHNFTPRLAMNRIGTDVIRRHFHDSVWISSLERKIQSCDMNVVITDCRYPNEAKMIRDMGGKLVFIRNGNNPEHFQYSSIPPGGDGYANAQVVLATRFKHIHDSEWAWNNIAFDYMIDNSGTLEELYAKIQQLKLDD